MSLYRNFLPSDWKSYKISYDDNLLNVGTEIFNLIESEGKLNPSHFCNGDWFRRAICTVGQVDLDSNYSDKTKQFIEEKFINYLGIKDIIRQFKVEEQKYVEGTVDGNKYFTRIGNISPSEDLNFKPIQEKFHGSAWWHTDSGTPRQNLVLIVYLTDVTEDSCPLHLSDPPISMLPNFDNDLAFSPEKLTSTTVPEKIITGPAGTVVCFSSHILHRASFCHKGTSRRTIQINLHLDEEKYTCDPYMKSHY